MEIFTLIKANIRRKKGSFVSIIIMMIIISVSLMSILSLVKNCEKTIAEALEYADTANITAFYTSKNMSNDIIEKLKANELTGRVDVIDSAFCFIKFDDKESGNLYIFEEYDSSKHRRMKDDLSGYSDITDSPQKGEIYVTESYIKQIGANIGDTLTIYNYGNDSEMLQKELKISGIVVEPSNGGALIGSKQMFISKEDLNELMEDSNSKGYTIKIYKADNCTLSDRQFRRELNLETSAIDNSWMSVTKQDSFYYTFLFPQMFGSCLIVFLAFLMIIVLISIRHSIATTIEIDYVNLGVLKSMGLSKNKMRSVFVLQYLLAQVIGSVIGFAAAIPLAKVLGNNFQSIISMPCDNKIAVIPSILIIIGVIAFSFIFIFLCTRKISKISPVRAISGNKDQIYFDSRIITPISKKLLSPSLALRQFVSAKKRYIGTIAITTILVFFMVSVSALGDIFNSKSAMQAIGIDSTDIDITLSDPDEFDKNSDEIESVIKKYTDIEDVFSYINTYVSLNGENLICKIYKEPNNLCMLKGREPVYDNEIVVSQATSEELGINIGDTAQVSKSNKSADFMVVGIIQCPNDLGRNFAINIDGIKRMGVEDIEISYVGYSLSSTEHCQEIRDELNEKYSDILSCEIYANDTNSIISSAFDTLKLIIYTISAVFALVVVIMVCKKIFLQEKTDIGIYKAVGFKCTKLRLQFSVRFLIVALISSSFGIILSLLLSESLFEWMFKNIGVVTFKIQLSAGTVIIPAVTICICYFVFAFIVSRQVKKVDVKELITE